jgi:hypothetical protein
MTESKEEQMAALIIVGKRKFAPLNQEISLSRLETLEVVAVPLRGISIGSQEEANETRVHRNDLKNQSTTGKKK